MLKVASTYRGYTIFRSILDDEVLAWIDENGGVELDPRVHRHPNNVNLRFDMSYLRSILPYDNHMVRLILQGAQARESWELVERLLPIRELTHIYIHEDSLMPFMLRFGDDINS